MKLNELEILVLKEFINFSKSRIKNPEVELEMLEVESRIFTGAGFSTDLANNKNPILLKDSSSFTWGEIGAFLNDEKINTGYVLFIEGGVVTNIEGYSYTRFWPKEIKSIEIYKINDFNKTLDSK